MAMCCPSRATGSRAALLALFLLAGTQVLTNAEDTLKLTPADIDRDALPVDAVKAHVERLKAMGSRVPGAPGAKQAREYIISTLSGMGYRDATKPEARSVAAVPETKLVPSGADGQKFAVRNGHDGHQNLRVIVRDADNSIKGGKVVVTGKDRNGDVQIETIDLPASATGKAEAVTDRPFSNIESLVLKDLKGELNADDAASAIYDGRYAIGTQRFWGSAPYDPGDGTLRLTGLTSTANIPSSLPLYGLWPNCVAVTRTPAEGISAPLVYAGRGRQEDYDGLPVDGAIVVLEVTEQSQWSLAAGLKAKGVIYLEPERVLRPMLEALVSLAPVEFPRMWLPRPHSDALREALKAQPKNKPVQAIATVRMEWKQDQWENVFLLVPGSGKLSSTPADEAELEKARRATIVLAGFYDSMSIVPALAPGAEQALTCAAMLELARQYRTTPPARDVLLVFCEGHFQALKGERDFFAFGEDEADLPESLPELDPGKPLDVRRMLLNAQIQGRVLDEVAARPDFEISRPAFLKLADDASKAFAEQSRNLQGMSLAEAERRGAVRWIGVVVMLAFLLFGLGWFKAGNLAPREMSGVLWVISGAGLVAYVAAKLGVVEFDSAIPMAVLLSFPLAGAGWRWGGRFGRGVVAGISWGVTLVILLYSVVLPLMLQTIQSSEDVGDPEEHLEMLLRRWKDASSTRESEFERQCRVLRNEKKKGSPQYEEIDRVRNEFLDTSQCLFSLTEDGERMGMPENAEKLRGRMLETSRDLRATLHLEERWAATELERREWNKPCRDLVMARVARGTVKEKTRDCLFLSLDMSAGNPGLGLFYKGEMYRQPGDIEARYKGAWGRLVMPVARAVEQAVGAEKEGALMPDTLVESGKRNWATYQNAKLAVAAEVAVQAQVRGLTLATVYDGRMQWNTPQDDGRMDWDKVKVQLRLVGPFLRHLMASAEVTRESRFEKNMKFTGYSQVLYEIVRPGGSRSIFPNVAVPNALICQVAEQPVFAGGVRRTRIEMTNPAGIARVTGMLRGWDPYNNPLVEIYQLDNANGEVAYALNKPKHTLNENQSYGRSFSEATRREKLELCRVQGLALLDVVDPGRLVPLRNCTLLAGRTESKPLEYSSSHNYMSEPHRVLFAEPGSRIKMLFREGQLGLRLAVLDVAPDVVERLLDPKKAAGVTLEEARGRGIQLGSTKIVDWLPLRTATDLWSLGEKRIQNLRTHSIGNARLDNPAYPGKYSKGRVTVTEKSRQVKGEGVSWDERILGLPFRLKRDHLVYTVEKLESPNVLVLNSEFDGATAANQEFVLTREKPGLHNLTYQRLEDAAKARSAGGLGKAWQLGTEAWGIESRAYPEVLGTANDSVLGVVFYLFLLLPFCFFLERLLFASPRIEKQIALFFTIFVLMFAVLWLVHPAFELVAAPPIILLAFVIMSLSGIVTAIVYGKFNTEMRLMQQGVRGVQSAEVNRASAVLVAVSLGISQMRRRRVRTALTCVTVILLTFIALSFTSTVQTISQAHVDLSPGDEKDSPYSGILLRQLNFDALRPEAYEQVLRETAGVDVVCAPRYWLVAKKDQQLYVDVLGDSTGEVQQNDRRASPSSLVGLSPEETRIFPKIKKSILDGGRWLEPGDRDVCLLSERIVRDVLKLDPKTAVDQKTKLRIGSYTVTLIGVFNSETLGEVKDLDGETLSPADFSASAAAFGSDQQPQGQSATVENLESAATAKYIHVDCADTVIVPWRLSQLLGADLRSVGVRVENDKYLQYLVDRVLQRLEKNIYVGKDGRRQFYASTGKMSLAGLGNLVVPLLISVLILLNTMIGAVYERGREITIFSSLGLAPSHIAALFMAEALVYATLGAIFGYLVGQGVAKIIQMAGISGLYLNYSSSSAVFVTAIVMLSVLGSTLYPAILAARAAAPSEERSWGVPEPKGDEISLELPFSFQRDLVPGVALFLHEFFDQHSESTLGKFTAKEVTLEAFHTERGQGICLFFMAWLTPYDLGVSQEVQIYIIPETENLYVTEATFYRVSGYVNSWRRVNLPFLNALRKHFLIWRTYSAEQRQEYAVRGFYQFIEAFDAVGWPAPEGAELPEGMPQAELDEEGRVVGDSGGKGTAPAPA